MRQQHSVPAVIIGVVRRRPAARVRRAAALRSPRSTHTHSLVLSDSNSQCRRAHDDFLQVYEVHTPMARKLKQKGGKTQGNTITRHTSKRVASRGVAPPPHQSPHVSYCLLERGTKPLIAEQRFGFPSRGRSD